MVAVNLKTCNKELPLKPAQSSPAQRHTHRLEMPWEGRKNKHQTLKTNCGIKMSYSFLMQLGYLSFCAFICDVKSPNCFLQASE